MSIKLLTARSVLFLACIFFTQVVTAQSRSRVTGHVSLSDSAGVGMMVIMDSVYKTKTDEAGYFEFRDMEYGKKKIEVYSKGKRVYKRSVYVGDELKTIDIDLEEEVGTLELQEVTVAQKLHLNGLGRMESVRGTAIFEAKKNDVLVLKNINANLATNTARQVFAKVAGTNVWENDGSGIQLNVSSRGLSPNRSWEYNMRQNEYDIAADIMGYPDMYYSPPMDAISHIEVVRGSASLQYGTQMGGLMNFVLKKANPTKPLEVEMKQSVGSFGLFNSYNSISGTKKKWSYFGYYAHRTSNGWRENSDYHWNSGFASVAYKASDKLKISAEYTHAAFLLHLSAGLTDSMYAVNPQASVRERNWFKVDWNVPSVRLDYKFSDRAKLSIVNYMLLGSRKSIENTKPVNIIADAGYRYIRVDRYHNFGSEIRYVNEYHITPKIAGTFAGGMRYYKGRTKRGQGLGNESAEPGFGFLHPSHLEYSDYLFRNENIAFFAENVFRYGKFSLVPGMRFENIRFLADGYYNSSSFVKVEEHGLESTRHFPLFGTGAEFRISPLISLYGNYTQGFRAANFNDIRITAPNLEIDPNLKDSRGSNTDIGIRGKYKQVLNFDVSAFYLQYNDRIGIVTRKRTDGSSYQVSTNVSDSRNTGMETFAELNIAKLISEQSKYNLSCFVTYSYIDAKYVRSEKDFLKGKKVETSPRNILRTGITFKRSRFSTTLNYSYTDKQFSDANNTVFTASGSNGFVPAYSVADWSGKVSFSSFTLGLNVNNFTNNKYFTRRATSYPGPGIITAEPRNFLVSAEIKL